MLKVNGRRFCTSELTNLNNGEGLEAIQVGLPNCRFVQPGDNLQDAYDWLKSSDRNLKFGSLGANAERHLVCAPGVYTGNLVMDTNYVNLVELRPGGCTFTGTIVVSSGVRCRYPSVGNNWGQVRRYRRVTPLWMEPCDTIGDWTAGGTGVVTTSTTSLASRVLDGSNNPVSIQLALAPGQTVNATMSKTLAAPVNLSSGGFLVVRYYLASVATDYRFNIILSDSAGNNAVWFQIHNIYATGSRMSYVGWHEVCYAVPPVDATYNPLDVSPGTYANAVTNFQKITIRIDATSVAAQQAIVFDRIMVIPKLTRGFYAPTFDDCRTESYRFAAYLAAKNMSGTFYVPPGLIGTTGYCTESQLRAMQDMGHLIGNHTWNHLGFTDYSFNAFRAREEFRRARLWLDEHGFAGGAIGALPGGTGQWVGEADQSVLGQALDTIRFTNLESNSGAKMYCGLYDLSRMMCEDNHGNDAPGNIKTSNALLACSQYSSPWVYLIHPHLVGGTDFSWENWTAHIDAVAALRDAGTIDVGTIADLQNMYG